MKSNYPGMGCQPMLRLWMAGVLGVLALALWSTTMQAAPPKAKVVPPQANYAGQSYAEWSAAWWQWALALPADQNPFFDDGGCANGANGQSGHVWFLTGVINVSGIAERSCTVPVGKALFFPVINAECSTIEPPPWYGGNEAKLRECAKINMDANTAMFCKIDGVPVAKLQRYRVQSPVFSFTVPENNVLGVPAGSGLSVSDGIFLMLQPLSAGRHTIEFGGGSESFALKITYHLTVENVRDSQGETEAALAR